MNLEPDEPQVIESNASAPARARGKQDSESQVEKLGSEAQAMTPSYKKMLRKLEDSVELYKLHVKHYHMSPTQFRRRTSMLGLPDSAYEKMKTCTTSVVCAVLQVHHRREPGFQAYELPILGMSSLLIMPRSC